MKLNGYRCDECKKECPPMNGTPDSVPCGWFAVKLVMLTNSPISHLCSTRCLYQWSSNQLEAEASEVSQ